jgi:O-antigen/teichoic acid export membrane protein
LLPALVIIAGLTPTFIELIAGFEYVESIPPAIVLLGSIFIQFLWRSSFGRSVFILKSSMGRFYSTLFESIVLLLLLYFMGSVWGIMGFVIARLVSSTISGIFVYYYVRSEILIQIKPSEIITVLFISLLMGSVLWLSNLFFDNYFLLGAGFLVGGLIYLIFIRFTISNSYYKSINEFLPFEVQDPFKRILN